VICIRGKKLDGWQWADAAAPSLALGAAVARVGCLLTGCCYGIRTDLPWAVVFTTSEVAPLHCPLHPTQIYHLVLNSGIFLFLLLRRKRTLVNGELILWFVVLYAVARSLVEPFRANARYLLPGALSVVHLAAAVAIVVAWSLRRRIRRAGGG